MTATAGNVFKRESKSNAQVLSKRVSVAIFPAAAIFVGLLKEIGWLSAESGGGLTFINEFQI